MHLYIWWYLQSTKNVFAKKSILSGVAELFVHAFDFLAYVLPNSEAGGNATVRRYRCAVRGTHDDIFRKSELAKQAKIRLHFILVSCNRMFDATNTPPKLGTADTSSGALSGGGNF